MRSILKRFFDFLFFADLSEDTYKECIKDIQKANLGAINAITLVSSIIFAGITFVYLLKGVYGKEIYIIFLLLILPVLIYTKLKPDLKGGVIAILGIYLMAVLYIFGIMIGVIYNTDNCSVTFVAIVIAFSILFVERPWRIQIVGAFFTFWMCALSVRYKAPNLALLDTLNSASFFVASCYICPYIIKGRVGGFHIRRQLEKERDLDALTEIYQRGTMTAKVESYFAEHKNDQCAMMLIDVDDFKKINDSYGHPVGDKVLKVLARSLFLSTTGRGFCGRYGGDEFCAFYFGIQNKDEPERYVEEFISNFKENDFISQNGEKFYPTISVGVFSDSKTRSFKELIKKADEALYEAKEKGKDGFVIK